MDVLDPGRLEIDSLRDEELDGQGTFVVERYPVDKKSGYTRQIIWIDTSEYRTLKMEFYEESGVLRKVLTPKSLT